MKNNPKKQQIIKAAQKRFIRHGLAKTTVEEIARDLRIGKATVYHYFVSKEEIFYEVLKAENDRYLENIAALFNNPEISFNSKIEEYFKIKTALRELFPLLSELLFLIINEKAIEKEIEIFRYLLGREESLITGLLKTNSKENAGYNSRSFVFQSFGYLFTFIMSKTLSDTDSGQVLLPLAAEADKTLP